MVIVLISYYVFSVLISFDILVEDKKKFSDIFDILWCMFAFIILPVYFGYIIARIAPCIEKTTEYIIKQKEFTDPLDETFKDP